MTKLTIPVRYQSWVAEEQPTKNYFGLTGYLAVDGTDGKRKQAVLWFPMPFGPDGGNVLNATLTLKTRATAAAGSHTMIVGLAGKWSTGFRQLTFTNRPGVAGDSVTVSKSGALAANTAWAFDVTKQVQAVADGQGYYGFVVHSTVADPLLVQHSSMGASLAPTLTVEWSMAPKAPTSLAPSGGRSVGERKPTLRWDFFDHAGSEVLQAVQVQISDSTNFATPTWDSGVVATHWCSMDLGATTFGGLADGVVAYWRVRNQDGAGLWSQWSAPQAFRYDSMPVVALQNPGPTTKYVADSTPPIDWTVTGGTQVAYRAGLYVLHRATGEWVLEAQSGYMTGATTQWTPSRPLRFEGATYKAAVDVFDGRDREATPGCPDFSSDVAEFTFQPGSGGASAANLTANVTAGSPLVRLRWTADQQPDSWLIYRDGILLRQFVGSSLLIGGIAPNYGFDDKWCPAGTHTWSVVAVTAGSTRNTSRVTRVVDYVGTWLVDLDTDRAVRFIGDEEHDLSMPEDVAVHVPLGARHGFAITGGQRGYEGTIQGDLVDGPTYATTTDSNARVWHDNLLEFKREVGNEFLLLVEDLALPVKVTNIDVTSLRGAEGGPGTAWAASLSFRQVAGWTF